MTARFILHKPTKTMKILKSCLMAITLCLAQGAMAQTTTDYLKLGNKIHFAGQDYHLVWSSHPSPTFYKQEYVAKGDTVERYQRMIMVDYLAENVTARQAVELAVKNIEARKQSDGFTNYRVLENGGEYLLDFMLSQRAADGTIEILERNVYRYMPQTQPKGLVVFAVSDRAYTEADIAKLVQSLKSSPLVNQVLQVKRLEMK